MAGGFGDSDAAWYHGIEHMFGQVAAKLRLDVLGEAGALIVHGDQHAGQNQRGIELAPGQVQGLEELHQSLERQVLGLHGDDQAVRGAQRVHGHRPERRRAIEQGEREARTDRTEAVAQASLESLEPGQFDGGAREVATGGDDPQVVRPGGPRRDGDGGLAA